MLRLTDALVTTHVVPKAGAGRPGGIELSQNNLGGTSFTAGDGPQTENRTLQNGSVLSALKKLTGKDFGYNEKRWAILHRELFVGRRDRENGLSKVGELTS